MRSFVLIMPRIAALLLACNLMCVCSAYSAGFFHCDAPEWFSCDNGKCVSYLLQCDGDDDCGDGTDEKFCSGFKLVLPSVLNRCATDEFRCKNSACIPEGKFCDTKIDCADGSDEYVGCVKELKCDDKFQCQDGHCARKEWVCDGTKDCPDGSDEWHCDMNETFSASRCKSENDRYLCTNQRCIPFGKVCDGTDNCGDGSDEGVGCKNGTLLCAHLGCHYGCRITPRGGPVCVCQSGYKLENDNRTCIDINECTDYGICDQRCVNTLGSYMCSCQAGYVLQDDLKTCKADGGEATMVFSTKTEIRGFYLESQMYFVVERNLSYAIGVAVNGDHVYWSEIENGDEAIVKKTIGGKSEVVVTTGLHMLSDIAVDWITNNIYFTDEGYMRIGVCNNNGTYCTILISEQMSKPKGLALLPSNGLMYWCDWSSNPRISMAGMDGKDSSPFITENLGWPISVTIDYPNNRLYWVDSKLGLIESIRLDGTDRRVVLQDMIQHPYSLAVFENKLYWSDWESKTIQSCDKFSGKNWQILIRASDTPYGVHIDHSAIKPKTQQNPCRSNPCSQLCVLNRNKGYTCVCTLDKELNSDNHTCREAKKEQHIIIAADDTFIDYYHDLLGKPKVTASVTFKHITAITFDSLSGTVLASDHFKNNIFRYDPRNGDIKNLITIQNEILSGMAFDYIGNNLYLSNIEDKSIEVYSLTTAAKTIFYFREPPYDIALVSEEGIMFVVFREKNGYRIDKMKMSGIGPRTRFVQENLSGPKVSLCYDKEKRMIFWSDQGTGRIESASLTGSDQYLFRTGLKEPVSLAIAGEHIFWTQRGANRLFWADKNNVFQNNKGVVIRIPSSVEIPHLTVLHGIIVHDEHGCRRNNGNCSHVCLPSSATSYICACPPEMMLSTNNRTCSPQSACPAGQIKCSEHDVCIKPQQWCNGIQECPNGEDEPSGCEQNGICGKDKFMCKDGTCINLEDRCNSHSDCADNSDEDDCIKKECQTNEFQCHEGDCISNFLVCNGHYDCPDFSDELNCNVHTCSPYQFMCKTRNCIPKEWECDGERDCLDGSDESEECEITACGDGKFTCANGRCISISLKCDGSNDCGDESDERRCLSEKHSGNCTDAEYLCRNTDMCLPKRVRCNGIQDCPKNDDEHNCAYCLEGEFTCDNRKCIPQSWVCDKTDDCGDKSDEKECGSSNWSNVNVNASAECEEYQCTSGACIPFSKVCDGVRDCSDDSDEHGECTVSCAKNNHCQGLCYKTPKGGVCGCQDGYRLAANMMSCEDINECESDVCAQICRNTIGSFECSCHNGYVIRSDKVSCKVTGPSMELITITNNDIRKISSNLRSIEVIHSLLGLSVTGLDANAIDDAVYWSSDELGIVSKVNVKTKESKTASGVGNPGVLAVDYITNNIYFNDNNHPNTIKVCNLEQQKCTTVVKIEGVARVTSLIVVPRYRWLFWGQTTWQMHDNLFGEICRTSMMGSGMKMIGSRNIGIVSGMAIDHIKSRLYWADSFRKTIESFNLDGTQRSTFLKADTHQPLSIGIYENSLYWLMGSSGQLQKCKLYGDKSCETLDVGVDNVHRHFTILHASEKPTVGDNPCEKLKCDYMCVLKDNDAACICQNGKPQKFNSTCVGDTNDKVTFGSNNLDVRSIRHQSGSFSGILVTIVILIVLLVTYFYYRRSNLKGSKISKFSFSSIRFHNPSYDRRDEVAASLESATLNLSPGEHEYTNPVDDKLLKIANESNIKKSEMTDSSQSERKGAMGKQDISLISFTRS